MYLAFSILVMAALVLHTVAAIAAYTMGQPAVGVLSSGCSIACPVLAMMATTDHPEAMPMFYAGFVLSVLFFGVNVAGAMLHLSAAEQSELADLAAQPEIVTNDLYPSHLPSLGSLGGRRSRRLSESGGTVRPHRAGRPRRSLRLPVLHVNRNEHAHV